MKNLSKVKQTKNRKILIVLIVALLFATLAGFGVYKILTPQRTIIYVFNNDYAAGTQVTASMLTPVEVDSNVVVASAKASTGDVIITDKNYDRVLVSAGILRNDVRAGNVFTSSMLSTTGGNRIEMSMKKDAVAVTIGATNVTGVTNGLQYGSRVNVYANYENSTVLLLQNVKVLAVTYENNNISTVTLELTNRESMELIHAYNFGKVHLGLVDYTGYQKTDNSGLTYTQNGFSK